MMLALCVAIRTLAHRLVQSHLFFCTGIGCAATLAAVAEPTTLPSVESIIFASTTPMPVMHAAPELAGLAAFIERGAGHLPEGLLLQGAVSTAPGPLRLTQAQSVTLRDGFRKVYEAISADPKFAKLPSVVSQSISQNPARPGHYFLYRPAVLKPGTNVIVFLHGFGGNFQFYLWELSNAFPDHVIVCPSYGLAWTRKGATYLDEVLADVEQRLNVQKTRPWLMAISAGGPAAFAIYNASPTRFSGLISVASCFAEQDILAARADLNVFMINGVQDDRFPIEAVRNTAAQLRPLLPALKTAELPDGDHFFFLTMPDKTFQAVKEFMAQ